MRFTRHARNEMRLYDLTEADVDSVIAEPISTDTDPEGRPRFIGMVRGRRVRLVFGA